MASVAARVRCNDGANQMLPISIAASAGKMSHSEGQPSARPLDFGLTTRTAGSPGSPAPEPE
jgi:hypothetical protein